MRGESTYCAWCRHDNPRNLTDRIRLADIAIRASMLDKSNQYEVREVRCKGCHRIRAWWWFAK